METLVRQSRFLHQLVVDRSTSEDIGRVELPWMDPSVHRVLGFICKPKGWGTRRAVFALPQIHILGDDSIVLKSSPTRAELAQVQQLESLLGLPVWSEAGELLGQLQDCVFNLRTGRIVHYLMVPEGWQRLTGTLYDIAPTQIISYSRDRIMIANVAAANLTLYEPGLDQKLKAVSAHWKEDATTEWRSLTERAKLLAAQAKERLTDLTQQVSAQAKEVVEQASDAAQNWTQAWPDLDRHESAVGEVGADPAVDWVDLADLEGLETEPTTTETWADVAGLDRFDFDDFDDDLDWTWQTTSTEAQPEPMAEPAVPEHLTPLQLDLQRPAVSSTAPGDRPPVIFAPDVPPRSPQPPPPADDEPWV